MPLPLHTAVAMRLTHDKYCVSCSFTIHETKLHVIYLYLLCNNSMFKDSCNFISLYEMHSMGSPLAL